MPSKTQIIPAETILLHMHEEIIIYINLKRKMIINHYTPIIVETINGNSRIIESTEQL